MFLCVRVHTCVCMCVCVDAVAWNVKGSLLMIPNTREGNNTLRLYTSYFKFTAEIQGDTGDIAVEEELKGHTHRSVHTCVPRVSSFFIMISLHKPTSLNVFSKGLVACRTVTFPEVTSCPAAASDVAANLRRVDRASSWNQMWIQRVNTHTVSLQVLLFIISHIWSETGGNEVLEMLVAVATLFEGPELHPQLPCQPISNGWLRAVM